MSSKSSVFLEQISPYLTSAQKFYSQNRKLSISLTAAVASISASYVISHFIRRFQPLPIPVSLLKLKRNLGYFFNPLDIVAMVQFKIFHKLPSIPEVDETWTWCYNKLVQTSRSFAAVILELNPELREPVCLFYLVLRGLDSVEDDMQPSVESKVEQLTQFYEHLDEKGWTLKGFGEKPSEIDLLENFDKVIDALSTIDKKYFDVIADICKRMGRGMADFLTKDVVSVEDYELYCHYVAGLVGYGLSSLFGCSGLEDSKFGTEEFEEISNSMGLFLQKTNIIRDLKEDISENPPRVFWPEEIYKNYVTNLFDLLKWEHRYSALKCLNHMITDALKHAQHCLDYMKMLKDESVFKFCAIPQVMAISTLELCYNNYEVFQYEVKIRKGEAVRLILGCTDYKAVCKLFMFYAKKLKKKVPSNDPHAQEINDRLDKIVERCQFELKQ